MDTSCPNEKSRPNDHLYGRCSAKGTVFSRKTEGERGYALRMCETGCLDKTRLPRIAYVVEPVCVAMFGTLVWQKVSF